MKIIHARRSDPQLRKVSEASDQRERKRLVGSVGTDEVIELMVAGVFEGPGKIVPPTCEGQPGMALP